MTGLLKKRKIYEIWYNIEGEECLKLMELDGWIVFARMPVNVNNKICKAFYMQKEVEKHKYVTLEMPVCFEKKIVKKVVNVLDGLNLNSMVHHARFMYSKHGYPKKIEIIHMNTFQFWHDWVTA